MMTVVNQGDLKSKALFDCSANMRCNLSKSEWTNKVLSMNRSEIASLKPARAQEFAR